MTADNNRTPTFTETIQLLIDSKLLEVNTNLPGKIVSYDYSTNLAVVKPCIKMKYRDEDSPVELPTISNVPVAFPRIGDGHIRFPVNSGDEGKISFFQRSIDKWLSEGGIVDSEDPRKFSLTDAVFELGTTSQVNLMESSADETSLEIKYKDSYIEITEAGKFKITDGGANELFDILNSTFEVLKTATDTAGIPFNPGTVAAFEALRLKIFAMKG